MNDNNQTVEMGSGGGIIIACIVAAGIALFVLLSAFVDDIFTPVERRAMSVELDLRQADAPVK